MEIVKIAFLGKILLSSIKPTGHDGQSPSRATPVIFSCQAVLQKLTRFGLEDAHDGAVVLVLSSLMKMHWMASLSSGSLR